MIVLKIFRISIGLFILTFILQLIVCNLVAVKTKELNILQSQISQVKSQISAYNQEIYLALSISTMEKEALNQGFFYAQVQVKTIVSPTIARAF